MRRTRVELRLVFFVLAFSGLIWCGEPPPNAVQMEKYRQEIRQADLDFCRMAKEKGIGPAFIHFAAADAILLRQQPIVGIRAVRELYAKASGTARLQWEPLRVDAAASGDIGYSVGKWTMSGRDKEGKEAFAYGAYMTIWKRQADGSWKYVFDGGNGVGEAPLPADALLQWLTPGGFSLAGDGLPRRFGTAERKLPDGSIFDYINGGGEIYLKFGFRELFHSEYVDRGGHTIILDVYTLGSPEQARAALAEEQICPPGGHVPQGAGITHKAYRFPPDYFRFFVCQDRLVYLHVDDDRLSETLDRFAVQVEALLQEGK